MGRHLGIGSIDLRLVEARLDDGDLGVIGNDEVGTPPIAAKVRVCARRPVGEP